MIKMPDKFQNTKFHNISYIPENIRIVGTSHIAKESIVRINKAIFEFSPDFIAVELDKGRYIGLINETESSLNNFNIKNILRNIKIIGFSGYIFALIGSWVSGSLGKIVNMKPGQDMLYGIKKGKEKDIKIALIDQDIKITLARFSKYLTFKEKLKIFKDIIFGLIFPKKEAKKLGIVENGFDLSKIPSDKLISVIIAQLKIRYPNIYKVLIHERNVFMAKRLKTLSNKGKVLAIVGAGHKEGMEKILFRNHKAQTTQITYSFNVGNN